MTGYKFIRISASNCTMLSLEVKSLITNVPIQGAMNGLEKRLHEFHYSSIKTKEIMNLI